MTNKLMANAMFGHANYCPISPEFNHDIQVEKTLEFSFGWVQKQTMSYDQCYSFKSEIEYL